MPAPENRLKAALARGDMQVGLWLNLQADAATEIAGAAGYDWCLIDGEHGPYDVTTIQRQLRVLGQSGTPALVRVPVGEEWVIKQVLDLGAQSLLVPMVNDAEQARRMARAVRYAPRGSRGMGASVARAAGYGAIDEYVQTADAQICLVVQAETRQAVENVDEIAAVDGIDGVFIGPADLSADMGFPGNPGADEVKAAIEHAVRRIRSAGKAAGIIHYDSANFGYYRDLGITMLGTGADASLLRAAVQTNLQAAREATRP